MKKTIAAILLISLILAGSTAVYGKDYTDMKSGHWAYAAVDAMSGKEIIKGYPNGSFLPNNTVTYGEFIKMALIAATGNDAGNAPSGHWAMNYYNKALELKYFTEHDITKEKMDFKITRSDMALIISSILGDVKIDKYDEIQKGITDINYKTEHEYDITKAYATGILTGYLDNTFRPEKTLTRAEAATVIYRLVDESKRELPGQPENEGGATTGNVKDIVKNYNSFKNPGDGRINENLATAATYTIIDDSSQYGMTLRENRGTKWIAITKEGSKMLVGSMYLMKDGNIVELLGRDPNPDLSSTATYHVDITKMDYIVSLDPDTHSMLLIANPFKK